jgi:hypothetical protein
MHGSGWWLCVALIGAMAIKLLSEAAVFWWLNARTFTPLRRTALLMTGDLARATNARFLVGWIGGIVLPVMCVLFWSGSAGPSARLTFTVVVALLVLNLIGELLERYLFFSAVVAPKMPGAPTA